MFFRKEKQNQLISRFLYKNYFYFMAIKIKTSNNSSGKNNFKTILKVIHWGLQHCRKKGEVT